MLPHCFLSLLVCVIYVTHSAAVVISLKSISAQPFAKVLQGGFGMAKGGIVSLTYSISPSHNFTAYSYPLIVIVTSQQMLGFYSNVGDGISPQAVGAACGQPSMSRYALIQASGTITYAVPTTDQYSVLAMQCYTSTVDISMSIDGSMVNLRPYSSHYSHLQIQDVTLVRVFEGELLLFVLFIIGLIAQMMLNRENIRNIHYFFFTALLLRIIYTISRYHLYWSVNKTGLETISQDLIVSILGFFSDFASLLALLYLSLGLSTARTQLTRNEMRSTGSFLLVYFIMGLSSAACTSTEEDVSIALGLVAYILRAMFILGVIVSMNFTVTQVKGMLMNSTFVDSTPIFYARAKQFQVLRLVFIAYLLLPSIILLIQASTLTWQEDWVVVFLNDLVDILLIFHIGVTFSPLEERFLTRAFDGTFNSDAAHRD